MGRRTYTEEQITEFLEVAQEIGMTPAIKRLGYPDSWATGDRWAKARGVEVSIDTVKAHAAATREFYSTKDKLLIAQEGLRRVYETLVTEQVLTADDQKKLADAVKRHVETMNLLEGKATNITQSTEDDVFKTLLDEFNEKQQADVA